jgi:hypothetical protein
VMRARGAGPAPPSRVGRVQLRIRIPADAAADAGAIRTAAERRLVVGVLDALDAAVRARLGPHAIVRIRRLPIRWRLTTAELGDVRVQRRLGDELAEAVLAHAGVHGDAVPARPSADAAYAVFVDAAHQVAVAIVEQLAGAAPRFYHPQASVAALWDEVVAGGAAYATAVVDAICELGEGAPIAPHVPDAVAAMIEHAAPEVAAWPAPLRAAIGLARARSSSAALGDGPTAPRATPRDAGALTAEIAAMAGDPAPRATPRDAAPMPARDPAAPSIEPSATRDDPVAVDTAGSFATAVGGVVGLVALALELELPEILWCAGVPEGSAVARALACLVDAADRDDPLLAVLAGALEPPYAPPPPPSPPLAAWAVDEIAAKVVDALGRALARRGDVRTPDTLEPAVAAIDLGAGAATAAMHEQQLARVLAAAACARLDTAWALAPVRALAARRGRVVIDADAVVVELPLAAVDVDVRRAGLDANPGRVPWLGRAVRILYIASDGEVV